MQKLGLRYIFASTVNYIEISISNIDIHLVAGEDILVCDRT